MINDAKLKYSVGPLMYSPALNKKVADSIIAGDFGGRYSLALCLEDSIAASAVAEAEAQVRDTLAKLFEASQKEDFYLPNIFVRVREPEQIMRVYEQIKDYEAVFTGFIFPKYTLHNAGAYNEGVRAVNVISGKKIYMMPILESRDIVDFRTRPQILGGIKDCVDEMRDYVLNVRVGGNDFSNEFAARRHCDETIYDILPIAQLFGDILTVFSGEYVVSGPVWEFFSGENGEWESGLRRELKLDILSGFVGKTVIHPRQIPVVNDMLKVTRKDYEDAKTILSWDDSGLQVGKSFGGERMNEVRTNYNWAQKTLLLSEIYGVK